MNQREQTGLAGIDARAPEAVIAVQEALAPPLKPKTTHVGKSYERFEDPAILTGRGRYGDDLGIKPGTLHAAVLRSPHAPAELISIDTIAARASIPAKPVCSRWFIRRLPRCVARRSHRQDRSIAGLFHSAQC